MRGCYIKKRERGLLFKNIRVIRDEKGCRNVSSLNKAKDMWQQNALSEPSVKPELKGENITNNGASTSFW